MKPKMSPPLLGAIVILVFSLSGLLGCGDRDRSKNIQEVLSQAEIEEIFGPTKEQVALLAAKTNVDGAAVREILVTYLKTHDRTYALFTGAEADIQLDSALLLDPEARGRIADTILRLAGRHDLTASQVAAILVDYRLWNACGSRE